MIIPPEQINNDTLINLIEEYITREGTDYGFVEQNLSIKTESVRRQIMAGDVLIVFDASTQSVNLMTALDYKRLS